MGYTMAAKPHLCAGPPLIRHPHTVTGLTPYRGSATPRSVAEPESYDPEATILLFAAPCRASTSRVVGSCCVLRPLLSGLCRHVLFCALVRARRRANMFCGLRIQSACSFGSFAFRGLLGRIGVLGARQRVFRRVLGVKCVHGDLGFPRPAILRDFGSVMNREA